LYSVGCVYRQQYLDFIAINQRAAQSLGFNNLQDQWIERWGKELWSCVNYDYFVRYETEDFPGLIENVWSSSIVVDGRERSLELFYKHLHAYVRARLVQEYNEQGADISRTGLFLPMC
jgi:hypothetical protein